MGACPLVPNVLTLYARMRSCSRQLSLALAVVG